MDWELKACGSCSLLYCGNLAAAVWFESGGKLETFRPRYRLDCVSLRQPADGSRSAGDAFRTLSTGKVADVDAVESCLYSYWSKTLGVTF